MAITFNADTTNGAVITSDTSGEIELQANGVTKAKITANGLQDANGNSITGGMYRNLIINGDMQIWQRGTSASGVTSSTLVADRWKNFNNIGTTDVSQSTDTPSGEGFGYSHKVACASTGTPTGGNECYISQVIEAQNLQQLAYGTSGAKQITISFWVKSNLTGSSSVWLYQYDGARDIAKSFTINSANTWEKKTLTFDGDVSGTINNDNGAGLDVRFYLSAGPDITGTLTGTWDGTFSERFPTGGITFNSSTSNNLYITGLQLEVGSGASDFEFLPFDVQLARCQRYYHQREVHGGATADDDYSLNAYGVTFPVTMRTTPTITVTSAAFPGHHGLLPSGVSLNNADCISWYWDTSGSNPYRSIGSRVQVNYNASAEL